MEDQTDQPIQETQTSNPTDTPINQNPSPYSVDGSSSSLINDDYFYSFPPGYRFKPHDDELIVDYLEKKVKKQVLPPSRIHEVNLYQYNPETLAENYKTHGEKEWYFFTPRDRKYQRGQRPNRAAGDGYWKATGADKEIKSNGLIVGFKKALVFYKGKPPKGNKTFWIMHEFRVRNPPKIQRVGMRLDDWVLCRIYKKKVNISKNTSNRHHGEPELQTSPKYDTTKHVPAKNSRPLASDQESLIPNEPTEMDNCYNSNTDPMVFSNNPYNPYDFITCFPPVQDGFSEVPQPMADAYFNYASHHLKPIFHPTPLKQSYPIQSLQKNIMRSKALNQCLLGYKPRGLDEELLNVSKLNYADLSIKSDYTVDNFLDGIDVSTLLSYPGDGNCFTGCED